MKWDSVISRLPNLTTSTSSYDFTITQVFGIFKLYITVSAVYCVDPSSCIYVKIPNLTSVLRLVSVFPYFFLWFVAMFCADDKCLSKGNNSKNKLGKAEKKSENHWTHFLILAIKEKYALFPLKMYLTERKILRWPFWELNHGQQL